MLTLGKCWWVGGQASYREGMNTGIRTRESFVLHKQVLKVRVPTETGNLEMKMVMEHKQ